MKFINKENLKNILLMVAIVYGITVTINFSMASSNEISTIYTRDELSEGYEDLLSKYNSLIEDSSPQSTFLKAYPVGSIYISVSSTNPGTTYGGTWVAYSEGRTLVGVKSDDADYSSSELTGGSKTKTIQLANLSPDIIVDLYSQTDALYSNGVSIRWYYEDANPYWRASSIRYKYNQSTQEPFNVMQPYITTYMWKRVA